MTDHTVVYVGGPKSQSLCRLLQECHLAEVGHPNILQVAIAKSANLVTWIRKNRFYGVPLVTHGNLQLRNRHHSYRVSSTSLIFLCSMRTTISGSTQPIWEQNIPSWPLFRSNSIGMKTGWDTKELKADPVPLQQHSDPSVQKGAHPRTDGWPSQKAEEPLSLLSFQILFCQHCSDLWGSQFNCAAAVDSFVRERWFSAIVKISEFSRCVGDCDC